MKKMIKILVLMLLVATPFSLQSCDNDGYSLGDFVVSFATVKRVTNSYYLEADTGEKLWVSAGYLGYRGLDGQRVIANYTILSDSDGEFDHYVKVNALTEILTKNTEEVKTENDDKEFGKDNLYRLNDLWFSRGYLNVDFTYILPKTNEKHRISMVQNSLKENPDDGYIHLELRYNMYNNMSSYIANGLVSFSTKSIDTTNKNGFKIMWKNRDGKEELVTLDFKSKRQVEPTEDYALNSSATIE